MQIVKLICDGPVFAKCEIVFPINSRASGRPHGMPFFASHRDGGAWLLRAPACWGGDRLTYQATYTLHLC